MSPSRRAAQRRHRQVTRAIPIAVCAIGAFIVGAIAGQGDGEGPSPAQELADAWERGDLAAIHATLTPGAQAKHSRTAVETAYSEAEQMATVASVDAGETQPAEAGGAEIEVVQVDFETQAFGRIGGELTLPVTDDGVEWEPHMVFPGLEPGEALDRRTRPPLRAPILADDGRALAKGPAAARTLPLGESAADVVGAVGAAPSDVERELSERGFPPGSVTGNSGLELAFNERLSGVPGGQLLAVPEAGSPVSGERVLASSAPQQGEPLRTTIDPAIQQAAVTALGDRFGGVAVLDARKGSILALAGVAFSAPQPPGSTFKVITTVAALDDDLVELSDEFPVETSNSDIGREIANSHDAPCGGTFVDSFANSCNTVFAPLGAEVGGERLVETAESFGFNSPPAIYAPGPTDVIDPPASTLPTSISTDLDAGVTAIGQGQVLATPLQMASVAQTIANGGVRRPTPIVRGPEVRPTAEPVEVTSEQTATTVRDLMIAVVQSGTGTAAALPDVQVAGKTGTAELGPKALEPGEEEPKPGSDEEPEQELDAWFAAFAPAREPRLATAVMIVNSDGDGGEVAAPIAREVLAAGLG